MRVVRWIGERERGSGRRRRGRKVRRQYIMPAGDVSEVFEGALLEKREGAEGGGRSRCKDNCVLLRFGRFRVRCLAGSAAASPQG